MDASAPLDPAASEVAAYYDRVAGSFHRWWEPVIEPASLRLLDLVGAVVADRPDAVVVDVGAGAGPCVRAAVARWPNANAIAIDPSSGMLEIGRAEAERTLEPSALRRIEWLIGVAERLPVADEAADAVVSSFTLQYLPNRIAALREAHRVLRPGGVIAVVTWLADGGAFRPWRLLDTLLDELRIDRPPSPETGLFRSLPSAAALLRRAGFRHVHAAEGVVEHRWTLEPFLHCAFESEERELFDSLDVTTRDLLERRWTEQLRRLPERDFHYRERIVYVTGRRPAEPFSQGSARVVGRGRRQTTDQELDRCRTHPTDRRR